MKGPLLLLHQGAIGDLLLAASIARPLADALAVDEITAIVSASSGKVLAEASRSIDRVLSPEQIEFHTLFGEGDIHESLSSLLQSASVVLSFLSNQNHQLHRRLTSVTDAPVFSLDPRPSEATIRERIHITQQYAQHLVCIDGPAITPAFPSIRLADSCSHKRWQLLMHPGSGGAAKCWPVDRFLELASQLRDLAIAWMVGPVECERAPDAVDAIRKHASRYHHDVITEPDLGSAVCSLACANLYLGNDSGMTHMAAAARCEVIALFGPTDPAIWRPLGKSVRVIAADRQHAHMSAISVDQVAEAIQQML